MPSSLFLIAGGGTGAKVAEALVHLSATGLGPDHVHILFVDADTTNGNLARARSTADDFAKMQQWPWGVRTRIGGFMGFGGESAELLGLFHTKVAAYGITQPVAETTGGSLRDVVSARHGMQDVLDLLYDTDEQTTTFADGFRARPNLGCLIMAQHLRGQLRMGEGAAFMQAMRSAGTGNQTVSVVIAASIFGGTGASLLPVARGCVEDALRESTNGMTRLDHLRWGAVMMLPHYRPETAKDSVDPDRYLLDAAGALQFYSAAQQASGSFGESSKTAFDVAYVIGSDDPARNSVKTVLGFSDQANPSYFEELVAAMGALHFGEAAADARGNVRIFHVAGNVQKLSWDTLPISDARRAELSERFAYLIHLGAFFLRQSPSGRDELAQGLELLLRRTSGRDLRMFKWYTNVIDKWAENHPAYKNAGKDERPAIAKSRLGEQSLDAMLPHATRYFSRLMLWADSALRGESLHLVEPAQDDYSSLYSFMSQVTPTELDAVGAKDFAEDNALVRLMRASLLAMVNAHENTRRGTTTGSNFGLFHSADNQGGKLVGPRFAIGHIRDALGAQQQADLFDEYTRTRL